MTASILFLNGAMARLPICRDPHTGEPYVYARNANGITIRVYVEPGESCDWVEKSTCTGYASVLEYTRPARERVAVTALAA